MKRFAGSPQDMFLARLPMFVTVTLHGVPARMSSTSSLSPDLIEPMH